MTLTLLGIGTAISILGDSTLYTVLPHPDIAAQLGITLSMVGILLGANRAIRLLMNGLAGSLFDRMPRRGFLVAALTLGAISSVFYAIAHGFWLMLTGRVLWGVAWAFLWVGGNTVVLDISTTKNRGRNSGIYQMWFFIGVASASFIGALLTDIFGFRTTQWICVTLIGTAALTWFLFLPETRPENPVQSPSDNIASASREGLPWRIVMASSATVFVARFISWGVLAATAILWLGELFGNGLQISSTLIPIVTLAGLYTALSNLTSIGSTPLVGSISDRIGRRWPVIAVSMLLGMVGLWMMSADILAVALIGAFFVPVAGSSAETLIPAIAGDRISDELRSRALGVIYTLGDLGASLGPIAALGLLNANLLTLGEIYRLSGIFLGGIALLSFMQKQISVAKVCSEK